MPRNAYATISRVETVQDSMTGTTTRVERVAYRDVPVEVQSYHRFSRSNQPSGVIDSNEPTVRMFTPSSAKMQIYVGDKVTLKTRDDIKHYNVLEIQLVGNFKSYLLKDRL